MEFVEKAINSVLNQTYDNFELLIVDDGSTDGTSEVISKFKSNPKIRVIRQKNKGTAGARNTGLHLASGDYIAFLDSDDIYTNERLKIINKYLINNLNVQCIATNFAIWNGENLSEPIIKDKTMELTKKGLKLLDGVHFCTLVIKKDILNRIGLFDTRFYYIEDVEMWYRLHAYKYSVHFINDCSYYYRRYGDINKTASVYSKAIQRDVIKIDIKYIIESRTPFRMRFRCLKWLIGNVKKYLLNYLI